MTEHHELTASDGLLTLGTRLSDGNGQESQNREFAEEGIARRMGLKSNSQAEPDKGHLDAKFFIVSY